MKLIACLLLGLAALAAAETVNFDKTSAGALPPGWTTAMTHSGGTPKWEVLNDDSAPSRPNVLAQTSTDRTSDRFPLAILDSSNLKDGELRVRFKAVSGEVDQAAGIVWRYRDENNYYIVRANAREDNVVLYKVEGGRRVSLAPRGTASKTYGVKHKIPAQTWNALGVSFQGNLFTVYVDGQKLFEVEDSTFTQSGKAGLWTKADSVTYFDDFEVIQK
jgi:Domain of Unknown Function (DUF1080)